MCLYIPFKELHLGSNSVTYWSTSPGCYDGEDETSANDKTDKGSTTGRVAFVVEGSQERQQGNYVEIGMSLIEKRENRGCVLDAFKSVGRHI